MRRPISNCWPTTACTPARIRKLDDRAHLRPEDPVLLRPGQQRVELRHRLHHLDSVRFCRESLVDLEERHDVLLLPQVARGRLASDLAVHRVLEQDRTEDPVSAEARARHDPGTHPVDDGEHLVIAGVGAVVDAVQAKRFWGASSALVERRDEAVPSPNLVKLLVVHGHISAFMVWSI